MGKEYVPYWQKLKDPRWQRKRLEIMERDGFACVVCRDKMSPLTVHHGYYEKGLEPWEYPSETLWTLCESCHDIETEQRVRVERIVGHIRPGLATGNLCQNMESLVKDFDENMGLLKDAHAEDVAALRRLEPTEAQQ